jgi:hypothetical protein
MTKWKLVPEDPTDEQIEAMQDHHDLLDIYLAAVGSAPSMQFPVTLWERVDALRCRLAQEDRVRDACTLADVLVVLKEIGVPRW